MFRCTKSKTNNNESLSEIPFSKVNTSIFTVIKIDWLQNNCLINNTTKFIQNKSKQVVTAVNDNNKNETQEEETITLKRPVCDYADKNFLCKATQTYRLQTQRN